MKNIQHSDQQTATQAVANANKDRTRSATMAAVPAIQQKENAGKELYESSSWETAGSKHSSAVTTQLKQDNTGMEDASYSDNVMPVSQLVSAVAQLVHNSVPEDKFTNAVGSHSEYLWTVGTNDKTIKVWNIESNGVWDFHLSAILDPTGQNVQKFHFTLRQGPGKGTDAFAWYTINGHNKNATLGARADAGVTTLFTNAAVPAPVAAHVANINAYATAIFNTCKGYIK